MTYTFLFGIVFFASCLIYIWLSNRPLSEAELARQKQKDEAERNLVDRRKLQLANPVWRANRIALLYQLAQDCEQYSKNNWGTKVPTMYAEQAKMYLAEIQVLVDMDKTQERVEL